MCRKTAFIEENQYSDFNKNIVGISIARELNRANSVLAESINTFDASFFANDANDGRKLNYELYDYRLGGYGKYTTAVESTVKDIYNHDGLNLDLTYTGKAFAGMNAFIEDRDIKGQNILFIHTGGTPLFFDVLLKSSTPPLRYKLVLSVLSVTSILLSIYLISFLSFIGYVLTKERVSERAYVR